MKKNYFFKFLLLMIPFLAFVFMAQSGGRTQGFNSSSPGDNGATCTQCHSGGNFNGSPSITTNIPSSGYELNTDYTISVNLASTNAPRVGYQLTAEKISDNSKAGAFSAGTNAQVFNSNSHVTHPSPLGSGGNFTVDITWKSPSTDEGEVKFYASINGVDGDGSTSGDSVFNTNTSVGSLGISEANRLDFSMYPNPSSEEMVTIQLPTGTLKADVSLYDISGRLIKTQKITNNNNKVSVQNLSNGIYMFKVAADGKLGAQQFVKK